MKECGEFEKKDRQENEEFLKGTDKRGRRQNDKDNKCDSQRVRGEPRRRRRKR